MAWDYLERWKNHACWVDTLLVNRPLSVYAAGVVSAKTPSRPTWLRQRDWRGTRAGVERSRTGCGTRRVRCPGQSRRTGEGESGGLGSPLRLT